MFNYHFLASPNTSDTLDTPLEESPKLTGITYADIPPNFVQVIWTRPCLLPMVICYPNTIPPRSPISGIKLPKRVEKMSYIVKF